MRTKKLHFFMIGIACVLLLNWVGCNSKDQYIGIYQATDSDGEPSKENIFIELRENGKGVWKRLDEEVPLSWYIKDDELRIDTKDGGTMVGNIKHKGITMILPEEVEITFIKIL